MDRTDFRSLIVTDLLPPGLINRLYNGAFAICPEGTQTVGNAATAFVNYTVLTQSGNVQTSQLSVPDDTGFQSTAIRITQTSATAQRFGLAQTMTALNVQDLRSTYISATHRARFSQATGYRTMFALLEWDATANTSPVDPVADWTSTSYTSGQFFKSSFTVINYGYLAADAATWAQAPYIPYQAGPSLNNLVYMVWTELAVPQNGTLDLGLMQVVRGSVQQPYEYRPLAIEQLIADDTTGDFFILDQSNTVTGAVQTFDCRIISNPAFAAYNQFSDVLATMVYFGAGTQTIGASKQLNLIRADNTFNVGASGIGALLNYNLTAHASSDTTANVYGLIGGVTNAGAATIKGAYSRVIGSGASTGPIVATVSAVTPGASTSVAVAHQAQFTTTSRKGDYGYWINQGLGGTASLDYGLLIDSDISIGQAGVRMYAVGAGNFLNLKNAAGSSDLFTVTPAGAVVAASTITGTTLTGTTSLIAASNSNGITITQADISRNAAAGSMTIAAGTNAGNTLAFNTGGSARLALTDAGASVTGLITSTGEIRAGGDTGGAASKISLTNTSDVTANSTGVGTILFKGATSRNSAGFIKIYAGTTPYYIPVFTAITG